MYEPWGYQESNYYVSKKSAVEDDLSESKKNDKQELKDYAINLLFRIAEIEKNPDIENITSKGITYSLQ